jgi:hypothetical protein
MTTAMFIMVLVASSATSANRALGVLTPRGRPKVTEDTFSDPGPLPQRR